LVKERPAGGSKRAQTVSRRWRENVVARESLRLGNVLPVLGGTAGTRRFRCGGLHLFDGGIDVEIQAKIQEIRAVSLCRPLREPFLTFIFREKSSRFPDRLKRFTRF